MEILTAIQLNPKQVKQFIFMQFLDSIGFFDAKLSQLTIDTDKDGAIKHVSLKKNFDSASLNFDYPVDTIL